MADHSQSMLNDLSEGYEDVARGLARMTRHLGADAGDAIAEAAKSYVHAAADLADKIKQLYKKKTGKSKKIMGKQIGYETRSAPPVSFDVVLGSMLGFGSYTLYSNKLFGHMVSVTDNFDVKSIPFSELINPESLVTNVRNVPKGSDFYNLKEALSYRPLE